jgi:DNA-binding HxlR family transcriptional regulator
MQAIYSPGMRRTSLSEHPCSIARAVDVVGEWWTPLILRDVSYGVRRFSELQEDLGVSANVLSDRLDALVAAGILTTAVYQEKPQRSEYLLTEKGLDLLPALLALMQWGDRWTWGTGEGPVGVVHRECGHEVAVEVRCPHCDRQAELSELRATLRGRDADVPAGSASPAALPPAGRSPSAAALHAPSRWYPGHVSGERIATADGGVPIGT